MELQSSIPAGVSLILPEHILHHHSRSMYRTRPRLPPPWPPQQFSFNVSVPFTTSDQMINYPSLKKSFRTYYLSLRDLIINFYSVQSILATLDSVCSIM